VIAHQVATCIGDVGKDELEGRCSASALGSSRRIPTACAPAARGRPRARSTAADLGLQILEVEVARPPDPQSTHSRVDRQTRPGVAFDWKTGPSGRIRQ
jgi:hypothetical protein